MIIHKSFGLDLGTTNSTASLILNGNVVYSEEDKSHNKTIPSIVAVKRTGEEVVGLLAKNEFYTGNENSKKSIKREMGKNNKFKLGDKELLPEEISAKIISYCKECLINTINEDKNVVYDSVVITVPAYFNLAQKDATRKAGELAGLNVKMLLEEPTAAAINFAVQNNVENGLFFVFDLGGGTFDVSILEKTGNIPQVFATAGNNFLGGDNFDMILARFFLEHLKASGYNVENVQVDASDYRFRLLMFAAENVKKQLSINDTYDIYFPDIFKDNTGIELSIENFTREKFNDLIKEKVEKDIITECDKALQLLEEKTGKKLEDITHIIMIGGSTKIPYIKEVIKNKYCVTEKLKDLTIFEPDLSVSAGAAYVAHSEGFIIENQENNILINMNCPYVVDGIVYLSGMLINGNINKIELLIKDKKYTTTIGEDKTFIFEISVQDYTDDVEYYFYNNEICINKVSHKDDATIDIIAPTPIQNETIAVEIIDMEKGEIEKCPILKAGVALPSESIEQFKINEHSNKEIVLPIWEGNRKIFKLMIELPEEVKIGSLIKVKTMVDMVSNITLEVELDGKKLNGKYEYYNQNDVDKEQTSELKDLFEERIDYVKDEEQKEILKEQKENIVRELEEAKENNDINHYSNVSEKLEKIVTNMPLENGFTEEDFDNIGEEIKAKLTPDIKYTAYDIDALVFHGKRFIKRENMLEAKKCMDELNQINAMTELFSSPRMLFETTKVLVASIIKSGLEYVQTNPNDDTLATQINLELNSCIPIVNEILKKYENVTESEEMKEDSARLLSITARLATLVQSVAPTENSDYDLYKGLVSKS